MSVVIAHSVRICKTTATFPVTVRAAVRKGQRHRARVRGRLTLLRWRGRRIFRVPIVTRPGRFKHVVMWSMISLLSPNNYEKSEGGRVFSCVAFFKFV